MYACNIRMEYSPILNPPKLTLHYFAKYYSRQYFVLYGNNNILYRSLWIATTNYIHIYKCIKSLSRYFFDEWLKTSNESSSFNGYVRSFALYNW